MIICFQEAVESGVIRVRACALTAITSKAQTPVLNKRISNSEEQSKESLFNALTLRRQTNKGELHPLSPLARAPLPTLLSPFLKSMFKVSVQQVSVQIEGKCYT